MAVYFIQCTETGRVKIGTSVSPERRFETIEGGSPTRLVMLKVVPGDQDLERRLHHQLECYRLKNAKGNFTEWFEGTPEVLDAVEKAKDSKMAVRRQIRQMQNQLDIYIEEFCEEPIKDNAVNRLAWTIHEMLDEIDVLKGCLTS